MEEIQYIGEHLWVGQLGHFLVILAFLSSIFGCISFYKSKGGEELRWFNTGKIFYFLQAISIFGSIALIFYMMGNRMYEYYYAFNHVSDDLPSQYVLAAFWEGQEGSFLLWMFWHAVLGFFVMRMKSRWKADVLMTLLLIQAFIASMLLGIYIPFIEADLRLGSSPFALLRSMMDAPIFANASYVSLIEGTGLNPLLQNYWNTIHPPMLFLGFASTSIPFGYAIAGLRQGHHQEWLGEVFRWALFSGVILGTGILMGGAWAYEALSFGGYWAWDPVENTSLVPWIILIAGIHTNLVAKATGRAISTTFLFYILTFLFILYSTFLTRSGVLGDTSVHAFTEMGLENQLMLFLGFFIFIGLGTWWYHRKSISKVDGEEKIESREFWMYIGSLILLFSGLIITISTSLPVFNKLVRFFYDENYIGLVIQDPIPHYNKYQVWIGVFIAILSSISVYLRYKRFNWQEIKSAFFKKIGIFIILSFIAAYFLFRYVHSEQWQIAVLFWAGLFAMISNLYYLIAVGRKNFNTLASAISHLGFGILIIGTIFTGLNKEHITQNPFSQMDFMSETRSSENVNLIKGIPFFSKGYWMTYTSDTLIGNLKYFNINFRKVNEENVTQTEFDLQPNAIYSNDFSNIASWNPGIQRWLQYDIFTNISGYPAHLINVEKAKEMEDTLQFEPYLLSINDTFYTKAAYGIPAGISFDPPANIDLHTDTTDIELSIAVDLKFHRLDDDSTYSVKPALVLKNGLIYQYPGTIDALNMRVNLDQQFFDQVFSKEDDIPFESVYLKEKESTNWKGFEVHLESLNTQPVHKNYKKEEGDIAVIANLDIVYNNEVHKVNPIYIIRGNQQFSIKDYLAPIGLHIRFRNIDPSTGKIEFLLGQEERDTAQIPVLIAENVPRSDVLTLEAQIYPGINLVWLGSIMMIMGLLFSWIDKRFISRM